MQSASVNYVQAATGAGGVLASPRLFADWLNDGLVTADTEPLVVVDLFNRESIDGWDRATTGQRWLFRGTGGTTVADTDVHDGVGTMAISGAVDSFRLCYIDPTDLSVLNVDTTTSCSCAVPTGAAIEACTIYFRYDPTGNNYYQLRTVINTDATVTVAIFRAVAGVETAVVTSTVVPGLIHQADQSLNVRCKIVGSGISIKVWRFGLAEPAGWQLTATDSTISVPGTVGVRSAIYAGNSNAKPMIFSYDSFRAINGAIDDLTHADGGWSVTHHLDDGLPDNVTFISGVGTPTLTADLNAPPAYLTGGVPMQVPEYFSPYNELSPIYGLDRDVGAVTLDAGMVTAAGPERLRVFTGQMADIPVKSRKATLQAVSATRLKLARLVQPPAVNGVYQGANATWPISYALAACGVYASPPPQTGCRYWAPQHGSAHAFIPSDNQSSIDMMVQVGHAAGPYRGGPVRVTEGPFVAAVEYGVNFNRPYQTGFLNNVFTTRGIFMADGPPITTTVGKGKVEMWLRGDAVNLNAAPGGSGSISTLTDFYVDNGDTPTSGIEAWVHPTTRALRMFIKDGVNSGSLVSDVTLPTDGAWHFCGWAWDIAARKLWVNLDGTVKTSTIAAIVPAFFPTTENFAGRSPFFRLTLPAAEIQLTAGVTPDTVPWLRDIPFTPQAIVTPSVMELANVAETEPTEAWAYLSEFAQAELASMRTDENDVFNYLGFGWWVKDAQQVIAETYSTEFNTGTVDINIDPTKIRNEIVVSFEEVLTTDAYTPVFSSGEALAVPPGITQVILPFSKAAFELRGYTFTNVAAADTVQPMNINSISFNGAPDGTGFYYSAAYVTATVVEWTPGAAVVQFNNSSTITLYTANNKNWPAITLAAKAQESAQASVTDSDPISIMKRGERSLPVTAQALQTRVNALRLARRLKMALRNPQAAAEELSLFGDARRQPGDLVTFEDPSMTKVSGQWRAQSVSHDYSVTGDEVSYINGVIVRPTRPICVVGTGRIGQSLVGPKE